MPEGKGTQERRLHGARVATERRAPFFFHFPEIPKRTEVNSKSKKRLGGESGGREEPGFVRGGERRTKKTFLVKGKNEIERKDSTHTNTVNRKTN